MKREDIKNIFDPIAPDLAAKERMFENVLNHSDHSRVKTTVSFNFRKAIPALALAIVLAGGLMTYGLKDRLFSPGFPGSNSSEQARDMVAEDMAAPLINQFQLGNRHYIAMSDYAAAFGFTGEISIGDLGRKIATIEKSPDKSLIGCEIYEYIPAGAEAVVAVKRGTGYELFRFFTFESYNNNQDEDAIEYLKLFGIHGPEDIAKIQFIVHTESSKEKGIEDIRGEITDSNEIARFYGFYSVLKNSSDRYFEKLFGFTGSGSSSGIEIDRTAPPDFSGNAQDMPLKIGPEGNEAVFFSDPSAPADQPVDAPLTGDDTPVSVVVEPSHGNSTNGTTQGMTDIGGTGAVSVAPSQGAIGNALADPVTIRIYNKKGVYFDSIYYRHIGFISRFEVSSDFAALIKSYMK